MLLLSFVSCRAEDKNEKLTNEYLINNEWGPNIGDIGLYFHFKNDNAFETGANFEGGEYYGGSYHIVNNKLILKIDVATEDPASKGKQVKYSLTRDKNNIFFNEYLKLEGNSFYIKQIWNQKAFVNNGQKVIFNKIDVETINNLAIIRNETNYYQRPDENSPRFMFSISDDNTYKYSDWLLTVPSDILAYKVQLILKTTKKDNKGRYWYCIVLPVGTGGYDRVRLETSTDEWAESNIGWIKETDVKQILQK
jgi:hypothetical protein